MEVQLSAFKVVCVLYLFSFILGVSSQSVPLCGSDPLKNFTVVETTLNGNVADIVWLNQQDVFLLTDKYIAYHSQDGGASWENINPTLGISSGGIDQLYANADSSAIYLVGQVSNLWIYTPGASYQQVQIPSIVLLQPHPVEPLFCVAYTTNLDLYITSNQFNNYTKVAPQVAYGDWGSGLTYYYVANDASGSLMVVKGDSSPQLVDTNIRGLAAAGDLLFIAKPVAGSDSALQLFSSTNLGEGPWVKARFPVDVEENYYVIFGISVGSVIIGVIHEGLTNANLYMSDSLDADFVMVLPNIAFHTYDISGSHVYLLECRVLQVQGAIIANQYLGTNSQTVISFDNGGRWQPLTPPSGCTNEANCGVQLHITYKVENAPFGPLHTRASAVGLILGTGNIGTTLNNTLAGTSTFFTRTEGAQWAQIAQQSTMYEFADHGALMVVADNINPTNILSYSWNEALSFVQCQFTQNQLAIAGIVVEPTATSQSFLLYGQRQDSTTALVFLDFSTLHQRVCDESDYEIWSVLDGVCVLGQKVTYKRRKQTSECYNPDDFDAEQTTEICPCQPYDYECDYCFELEGTICKAVCSTFNNTCVDGKMTVSQGYRLVPGTKCNVTSGLDRLPITTSCPATSSNPNHGKSSGTPTNVIAAVVSVLIGVALIAAGVYLWKNDRTRRWVEDRVSWGRYKVLGKNESGSLLINQDENFSLDDEFDHDSDAPILNDDAIVHFSETSSPVK